MLELLLAILIAVLVFAFWPVILLGFIFAGLAIAALISWIKEQFTP